MNTSSQFRGRTLLLAVVCFVVAAFTGQRFVSASVGDGQIQQAALRHDTFDSFYRTPFGAVAAGANVYYSDAYADDNDNLNQGGDGAPSASEPFPAFQLTVYNSNFQTPAWLQNANVYQIFPDRFRNADKTNDYCVNGSTVPCPV